MKTLRIFAYAVAALLLLSWGAAFAGAPVPIFACDTEITEPGKYFLTQDLVSQNAWKNNDYDSGSDSDSD